MSEKPISPLRQRMLDDMNMRRFVPEPSRNFRYRADPTDFWGNGRSGSESGVPPLPRNPSNKQTFIGPTYTSH
jgi:hypothetical protein